MEKLQTLFTDFTTALTRLKEILPQQKTDITRDAAIQRFEFTFELAWKLMQEIARHSGINSYGPRNAIREAAQLSVIDNVDKWLDYLEERNLTTHTYKEIMADKLLEKIPGFVTLSSDLAIKVKAHFDSLAAHKK